MPAIREALLNMIPPEGLAYRVDDLLAFPPDVKCQVSVTVPTILLKDGVLRETARKTDVRVLDKGEPTLYELGVPICSLAEVEFPWSLDVDQKIPVPMSRDSASPAYICRLIGRVLEQAAMDGHRLLSEDQQAAGFVRKSLDWVREPEALKATVGSLYGDDAVRVSNDAIANAQAAAAGAALVPGGHFSSDTRQRLRDAQILPTSSDVYGGTRAVREEQAETDMCPACNGSGRVPK